MLFALFIKKGEIAMLQLFRLLADNSQVVTDIVQGTRDGAVTTAPVPDPSTIETVTTVAQTATDNPAVTTTVIDNITEFLSRYGIGSYQDVMNPSVWSSQSLEGIIVLVLILFIVYKLFHHAYKFAWWCIGLIFFIEIMYILGLTAINDTIPLHSIFPHSILNSIAQLCVGTKFSYCLYYIDTMLTYSVAKAGELAWRLLVSMWSVIQHALPAIPPQQ